jgi:sugar (Glycoside-Pentoside-Hexuronide) transporter
MNPNKPFGLADKAGYALGDFGNDFTFMLSTMFLMKFYTDVMGVSAALVGLMMMVARFVDAFTDVTMGQIVDRSKTTKNGKFRPWILRMMGPVAVASLLMYATWFKDMPMGFKIVWMFFSYLLWGSVCYTGVNIPYGSMASAITSDPKQRAELSTWRTLGATMAATACGVVLPMVIYYQDAAGHTALNGSALTAASVVCSILAVVCYILCYALTTERVKMETTTGKFSLAALGKSLVSNRSLIGIVVAALVFLLAQLSLSGMLSYIYPNYFGNGRGQSMANLVGTAVTLLCSFFAVPLSMKIGKKELGIGASLLGSAVLVIAFVTHTRSMTTFTVFYAIAYIALAVFNLIIWAMITDVIDDTEVRTGKRSDGTIYAVYSFARKMGQAASSGLSGLLLSIIGYSAATAFDPDVVDGIYNITCLAPAIGFGLLALALIFLYPLKKSVVEENARVLAERRAAK